MAVFQVPQFVEQKAKIVGSLTLAQFGYLAAAGLIIYGLYFVFNFFVWLLVSLPLGASAVFLAFAKVNGQESHKILQSVFGYLTGSKTYVWRRKDAEMKVNIGPADHIASMRSMMGVQEKIKSIALAVTTGKIWKGHEPAPGGEGAAENKGYDVATFETGEQKLVKRVDY